MARQWVVNTASGPRMIGGMLLAPGEGTWVEDQVFDPSPAQPQLRLALTATQVAALAEAGMPVAPGVMLADPNTGIVYGQSDGIAGYSTIGSGSDSGSGAFGAYPKAPNLAAVGSLTVPAPSTPANEYYMTNGNVNTFTDGANNWGGQQSYFTRCADGTCFALAFTTTDLLVYRSATGGAYGTAWTIVATIANTARSGFDRDAHIVHNPVTDDVHLFYTLLAAGGFTDCYAIKTFNSAGTVINDARIPNTWPGSGTEATAGWFAGSPSTAGSSYSSVAIGTDGTIVLAATRTTNTINGFSPTEMNALLRVQTMKWEHGGWRFSPIYDLRTGPRIAYTRLFVSPPGAAGFIVGVGWNDVNFYDYNLANNPNYNAATWVNTNILLGFGGVQRYYGGGGGANIVMWKIPLNNPTSITQQVLVAAPFRTTDLPNDPNVTPPTPKNCFAVVPTDAYIDTRGRLWMTLYNYGGTNNPDRDVAVYDVASGAQIARAVTAYSQGISYAVEDDRGAIWLLHSSMGNLTSIKYSMLTTTLSGSTLTVQDWSVATNLRGTYPGSQTAFGANLTSTKWEEPESSFQLRIPRPNTGAPVSGNWVEFGMFLLGDATDGPPGAASPSAVSGSCKWKRVRIQIPS